MVVVAPDVVVVVEVRRQVLPQQALPQQALLEPAERQRLEPAVDVAAAVDAGAVAQVGAEVPGPSPSAHLRNTSMKPWR